MWGYDFSVSSFGPEIEMVPSLKARAHFFPYALGARDAPNEKPPMHTLKSLMAANGHTWIDVLKVDVDGRRAFRGDEELALTRTEFDLLTELMRTPARVWTREALLRSVWGTDWATELAARHAAGTDAAAVVDAAFARYAREASNFAGGRARESHGRP